jgi:thiamine biosynthesis lipoprotein
MMAFIAPASAEALLTPDRFARHTFPTMGCACTVVLPASAIGVAAEVEALFAEWHQSLSRFNADSELSRLNAQAGSPVAVSPFLFAVLEQAFRAAKATVGLFDPLLEPTMRNLGYDRTFASLDADGAPVAAHPTAGAWRQVQMDRAASTVELPPDTGIDLGGIAKGMAVDASLDLLASRGVESAMVEAGGDLAVLGLPPAEDGWWVAVDGLAGPQLVAITRGALATSGVARRSWRRGGQVYHHLIDPRTGDSARSDLLSVSAAAGTCAQAEVAAKVALIEGSEAGAAFLRRIGVSALFVAHDGSTSTVGLWEAA